MCKIVDIIAIILLVIGGLNWGLIALVNFDLVATIFGAGTLLARVVYGLVGLAAVWEIFKWKSCCGSCSPCTKDSDKK